MLESWAMAYVLLGVVVGALLVWFAVARVLRRRLRQQAAREQITVKQVTDETGRDVSTGAVFSVQRATITTPAERLDNIWSPTHLERLARTYWRYMERFSLRLVRVYYDDDGRYVCFLTRRICLLEFRVPEYELRDRVGLVRWRIRRGLLVSRGGRDHGALTIEVDRRDDVGQAPDGRALSDVAIELTVTGFRPAMNAGPFYWIYRHTQSRYHVLLAYSFIHSLSTGRLEKSVVGRYEIP